MRRRGVGEGAVAWGVPWRAPAPGPSRMGTGNRMGGTAAHAGSGSFVLLLQPRLADPNLAWIATHGLGFFGPLKHYNALRRGNAVCKAPPARGLSLRTEQSSAHTSLNAPPLCCLINNSPFAIAVHTHGSKCSQQIRTYTGIVNSN